MEKSQKKDHTHWADRIAELAIARADSSDIFQNIVKNGYIIYDEKTPSGKIHIGSARGWVIHDCIAKALRSKGINAKFILSSDDMDPYDKSNKELDSSWDKYLGMPFRDIPSPKKGFKNFGDYYFSQVTEKFDIWGIECDIESTGERYENGSFNPQIKKILDNSDKVKQIYSDLYGEDSPAANKLPINIKCPKCKKIATTIASKWDPEKEEVEFECRDGVVDYATGCGEKGSISPYNGNSKFPWKVEWAAKWPTVSVIYESAGKDHFTKGGSRTISCKISVDVLDFPPPLPSDGYKTGKGYEFFTVGGKKMSTSKGQGMSFAGITDYAPAKMLRYLMVKSRPNSVLDFDPFNDNDLLLLYDRFDKTESIYFGVIEASEDEEKIQKRIYELTCGDNIPKKCPPHISLSTAAIIIQVAIFDTDRSIEVVQNLGIVPKMLEEEDKNFLKERFEFAAKWVKDFASERYKFEVTTKIDDEIKSDLSEKQKNSLIKLKEKLNKNDYDDQSLYEEFYNITKEIDIDTKDFFIGAYKILIKKEKGPKLATFILQIGKERVIKILEQI